MPSPLISVLLPTIRPHLFRTAFDSIRAAAGRLTYEVIVVADFPSVFECQEPERHLCCRWIERERHGPIDAINTAAAVARGTYLFVFNDESTLDANALEVLYDEAAKRPRCLYTPRHEPYWNFSYYMKPFAPFPFVHRDLVTMLGGLFDPAYGGFYADPDLSMRAHAMGVPIVTVHGAMLRHTNNMSAEGHQENLAAFLTQDRATFRSRWDHLGIFCDP